MLKDKLDLIEKLIYKSNVDQFGSHVFTINAIYNTINTNDLIDLFIETENTDLRNTLNNYLSKRLKYSGDNLPRLFNRLLKKAENLPYAKHQRIRIILSKFILRLSKVYVQKYFDYFSSTDYINDFNAALKVSDIVWNSEFDEKFINLYIKTGNEQILKALLKNGTKEIITEYLKQLWADEYLWDYYKTWIIRKICPENFNKLDFLKNSEPDKYLYAVCFSNQNITDDEALILFEKIGTGGKSFGLWCLGLLGKWTIIKDHIEKNTFANIS